MTMGQDAGPDQAEVLSLGRGQTPGAASLMALATSTPTWALTQPLCGVCSCGGHADP
jgi:hypothetical protein